MSAAENLGRQFIYQTRTGQHLGTTVVASLVTPSGPDPVGSMSISPSHYDDEEQWEINHGHVSYGHGQAWEDTADGYQQGRWSNGSMEPGTEPARVSWLGIDTRVPGHTRALANMLAIGVATHGSLPVADHSLSEHGARISRGMARKYGVESHPSNTDMSQTLTYGAHSNDFALKTAQSKGYLLREKSSRFGRFDYSYDDAQAGDIRRQVDEKYRTRPKKEKENAPEQVPGQLSLF